MELTELEKFQQKQLEVLADALAYRGVCAKGDNIHCFDGEGCATCQECWLRWTRDKVKEMHDEMVKDSA